MLLQNTSIEKMRSCDCKLYFIGTGAAVSTIWIVTLLILWMLRKKRNISGIMDTTNGQELTPVTDTNKEETLVYHQIAFSNGNKKPREKNPQEEVTYAQVKTKSQDMRRKKLDDAPINSDSQITYAEIRPMAHRPKPKPECDTTLYASVIKKKTGNA